MCVCVRACVRACLRACVCACVYITAYSASTLSAHRCLNLSGKPIRDVPATKINGKRELQVGM